jgi:hypothetical protein
VVVSGKASDVALGLSERVGDHAVDVATLEPGRFVAINSGGLLSRGPVSIRSVRTVAPSVGRGPCTVLPNGVGVSERVCDDAADVTAL